MRIKVEYCTLSDVDLVKLVNNRDLSAFTEIYNRYNGLLYIYSLKMIKDEKEAEDVVQDVFLALWGKHDTLELRSSLASYLYSAVRYRFFDLLSKKKVRSDYAATLQAFIDLGSYSTDDYINEKELVLHVEREVTNLPVRMRQVFELSRKTGMSHRLIAAELSLSEKTVRNHVNHALKILRLKLGSII